MLAKRDVSYYYKLGYAQAGIGAAILLFSFIAGVAAQYDAGYIHLILPYYVGILMVIQGGITLYAARSGKRWPLGVWLFIFFLLFCVMGFAFLMQRIEGLMYFEKFPCWTEYNQAKKDVQCVCGEGSRDYDIQMIRVAGATSIVPCARAQNTLYIMSNCIYAFSFIGLIVNLLVFVMACNDTCCVSCRRVADVPHFVIPGQPGQPGTVAVGVGETVVTYRVDEQPGPSTTSEALAPHTF